MALEDLIPARSGAAWVCYCHNAPFYFMNRVIGGRVARTECHIALPPSECERLALLDDQKWYVTAAGNLLENQGLWTEVGPPDGHWQRVKPEDMTTYVHMYLNYRDNYHYDQMKTAGFYIDDLQVRIRLRRNIYQQSALDSEERRVTDPHTFLEDIEREYVWVHTWVNYVPHPAEVRKAEYDWLSRVVERDFYAYAVRQSGLRQGVELP